MGEVKEELFIQLYKKSILHFKPQPSPFGEEITKFIDNYFSEESKEKSYWKLVTSKPGRLRLDAIEKVSTNMKEYLDNRTEEERNVNFNKGPTKH